MYIIQTDNSVRFPLILKVSIHFTWFPFILKDFIYSARFLFSLHDSLSSCRVSSYLTKFVFIQQVFSSFYTFAVVETYTLMENCYKLKFSPVFFRKTEYCDFSNVFKIILIIIPNLNFIRSISNSFKKKYIT